MKVKNSFILLNPGPVNLTSRVRQALLNPDICHREPEFSKLQDEIRNGLLRVYGLSPKKYVSILFTGSGTVAVESMIANFVSPSGKLLVLVNGVYGERIKNMAQIHNIPNAILSYHWGDAIKIEDVEETLKKDKKITHIAVVQHETTTGRLNNLKGLGALCRKYKKELLVDAVSSFGAEELNFAGWRIAACAASANKCLHGVPGVAFVIAKREDFNKISYYPKKSFYLDLFNHYQHQEKGSSPFTHAVHVFYAFAEALSEFRGMGGVKARKKRYDTLAALVRKRAKEIGLRFYLNGGPLSCVLTAFYIPDGMTYQGLHDYLRKHGFVIYAGQGNLSKIIFRIANMGNISKKDIERLFRILKERLCRR